MEDWVGVGVVLYFLKKKVLLADMIERVLGGELGRTDFSFRIRFNRLTILTSSRTDEAVLSRFVEGNGQVNGGR